MILKKRKRKCSNLQQPFSRLLKSKRDESDFQSFTKVLHHQKPFKIYLTICGVWNKKLQAVVSFPFFKAVATGSKSRGGGGRAPLT